MPLPPSRDYAALFDRADIKEEQFKVLFDNAPVGIAFVSPEGLLLRVNPAYCELLGYAASELEGRKRYQELTHPEDIDADVAESVALIAGKRERYRMAKRYLHKRGFVIPVDLTVDPVKDANDEFVHFVAHTVPVQLSEEFYRLRQKEDGSSEIVPFYPLVRLLQDNWKASAAAVVTLFGTSGAVVRSHYQAAVQLEAQTVQLDTMKKDLDAARAENKELAKDLKNTNKTLKGLPHD